LVEQEAPALDRGLPSSRQYCRDGDAACDLDGSANGRCLINVALCVNVLDTRAPLVDREGFPTCPPRMVRAVRLLTPRASLRDPFGAVNRVTLLGAIAGLPDLPIGLRTACTPTVPVIVPVGDGRAPGTRLRARASTGAGPANAAVHLRCTAS
jgi:hypothetical protein